MQQQELKPSLGNQGATLVAITEAAYIDLVAYSGQQYRPGKASLGAKPHLVCNWSLTAATDMTR